MKIKIIAIGKMKPSPHLDLCLEYQKRTSWKIPVVEIDSPKNSTSESEAVQILKAISPEDRLIALDERGKSIGSIEFTNKIQTLSQETTRGSLVFVIGGADGLTEEIRNRANFLMSFGKQTWPHMLVRVMLMEQVYRAQQILAGHPYHRA